MKISCGRYIVTIKPYVTAKRRKTFDEVYFNYIEQFEKLTQMISSLSCMRNTVEFQNIEWPLESVLTVINLAKDSCQKVNLLKGMADGSFTIRQTFSG